MIIVATYTLMILGNTSKVPTDVGPLLASCLLLGAVAHIANRIFAPSAHPVILPIAFLLNGLGYVMITRIDSAIADPPRTTRPCRRPGRRSGWAPTCSPWSSSAGHATSTATATCCWPAGWSCCCSPWSPTSGATSTGPGCGCTWAPSEFQPVELAKIVLCIFFASYFAEKRELLTIPTARFGNRLVLDPRPLVPIVLAWVFAIGVMSLEHDIGFSALLFTLFIGLLG